MSELKRMPGLWTEPIEEKAVSDAKHTPGPWQWVVNKDRCELVHPAHGYLIVMDFARRGMQGGQPRLATWKGNERENMGGIMVPASELDVPNHPDARLIAASPDLLAACKYAAESLTLSGGANPFVLEALGNAIAKAEGTATRAEQRAFLDLNSDADE